MLRALRSMSVPWLMLLVAGVVGAHPVSYPGNLMLMGETGEKMEDYNAVYTFAANHALSAGYLRMESDGGARERRITNLHYNHRLRRWNLPDAQANIYLQAGVGHATGNDFSGERLAVLPGIQADYETQRVYFAYRWHGMKSSAFTHMIHNVQAGFAPYAAEYDEIAPWFVLDVRRTTNLGNRTEITPTLRLIHKNVFFEAGVSTERRLRLNVMLNF